MWCAPPVQPAIGDRRRVAEPLAVRNTPKSTPRGSDDPEATHFSVSLRRENSTREMMDGCAVSAPADQEMTIESLVNMREKEVDVVEARTFAEKGGRLIPKEDENAERPRESRDRNE